MRVHSPRALVHKDPARTSHFLAAPCEPLKPYNAAVALQGQRCNGVLRDLTLHELKNELNKVQYKF